MNTLLNILPWALAILAGVLYYLNLKKVKAAKDLEMNYGYLEERYKTVSTALSNNISENEKAVTEKDKTIQAFKEMVEALNKEIAYYKSKDDSNMLKPLTESFDKHFQPVSNQNFPYQFRTLIDWADIEISLSDLIDEGKLFDVFTSLMNSNLFPESIENTIDYQKGDGQVIIYTQEFNEFGEVIRCLTWHEIVTQILSKKQIVTDYLKAVIQESDRATVVQKVLANKPKKEVTNA